MLSTDNFVFVEYNKIPYPPGYTSALKEIAAHLDKTQIEYAEHYSLHTEYCYGPRSLKSNLISKYPALTESHKNNIPQLWKSQQWASEFADFIIDLVAENPSPSVIEIHPPFNDYCTMDDFAERFLIFEHKIHLAFPHVKIVLENRAGALYPGGKFLVSKATDIVALCQVIEQYSLDLGIVLDFPQLLTAENIDTLKFNNAKYQTAIELVANCKSHIKGIHIWGKQKSASGRWVAHAGTLNTYFDGNAENKQAFIDGIDTICSNGTPRFFVPEVNSGPEDLYEILGELFGQP